LASNQLAVVGQHDEPISTCHWITSPNYNCLMTGGWDKTLRFWDMRQLPQQNSLGTIQLPDKVFCADMVFPMGAVALANRQVKLFKLDNSPQEVKTDESPLKYQVCCSFILFFIVYFYFFCISGAVDMI
jgi:mRNA export factor